MQDELILAEMSIFWIAYLAILVQAWGLEDFCRQNKIEDLTPDTSTLLFSKENSVREYGQIDQFKTLHCCVTGYRSIEWFKDDSPYPWSTEVSTLIVYPESWNQTIYTQATSRSDAGLYWCLARNETHSLRHEVQLHLSDSTHVVGPPLPTYKPTDQIVAPGDTARFYCEAYIGSLNLPDAIGEVSWQKVGSNISLESSQKIITREFEETLGAILTLKNVSDEDFGEYVCLASNTADEVLQLSAMLKKQDDLMLSEQQWRTTLTVTAIIVVMFIIIVIILAIARFKSRMNFIWRKMCRNCKAVDDKRDVLVLYHRSDDTSLNNIVGVLLNRCHYECSVVPVNTNTQDWINTIMTKAKLSRRLMVLISPQLVQNEWTCGKLSTIMKNLLELHPKLICIYLQELPKVDLNSQEGRDFTNILAKVRYLNYSESPKFWNLFEVEMSVMDQKLQSKHGLENRV